MERSCKQDGFAIGLQKMENQILDTGPGHLDWLQNIGAKVGHQYRRRTSTLDKIQDMVL
jgi:hypothetical protein